MSVRMSWDRPELVVVRFGNADIDGWRINSVYNRTISSRAMPVTTSTKHTYTSVDAQISFPLPPNHITNTLGSFHKHTILRNNSSLSDLKQRAPTNLSIRRKELTTVFLISSLCKRSPCILAKLDSLFTKL